MDAFQGQSNFNTDPINNLIFLEGMNRGFNPTFISHILPEIPFWGFCTENTELRINHLKMILQSYFKTENQSNTHFENQSRDLDDFERNPEIFIEELLESICAPQIIDPIIQVLSCYQDSIGNNTAEILNWYSVFLEKQNEIAYELQNQLNLSGSNYSPEENNQQMHEALINFNKNCNGWKVSIGRMIELCSLATNIIIFSIEKWKTQLRTSANNFEIKDIKGDFLDVPENLSENLIKLEKKTVTLCKSIFTLLDSVKLIKENNDLVNQYPSLILGSFNNQEIVYENHLQKLIILLAKMTLVIYNNPVQVLKDLNLFSASGFWLAGLGIRIDGNHIIRFQASIIPENEGYAQLNRSKSDLKHKIKTVRIKENQNGTIDLDSTLK